MNSKDKVIIGTNIQACRKAINISQQKLGDEIGISSTSISKIERGITAPKLENLICILNVLNVPADNIFYGVVHSSHPVKTSVLEQKLIGLSKEERNQILLVLETLINNSLEK